MKRKMYRKLMAAVAGVLTVAMLTACGSGKGTPDTDQKKSDEGKVGVEDVKNNTEKTDETLTVMLNAEPSKLFGGDPNEGGVIVANTLADSILEYDGVNKTWKPGLCKGFEKVDDLHYTFELNPDAKYSDGTPVTTEDCVYSLGLWKETGASNAKTYNMDETKVVDDTHFTLALTEYIPGWEIFLAQHTGVVLNKASVDAAGGAAEIERIQPLSAGRYKLKEWEPGAYIVTERDDAYWNKDYVGYYKYIKYVFVADSASRVLSVKSGDADIALRINTSDMVSLENEENLQTLTVNSGIYNVYFNNESGACADVKVREALSYAIDGNAVNSVIMLGKGELSRGWLLPEFPYIGDYKPVEHNVEKAKELLAEAGYKDGLELSLPVIGTHSQLATVVQESLRQAGVEVKVEVLEQQAFAERARKGDFDMIVGTNTAQVIDPKVFNQIDPDLIGRSVQNCRITKDAEEVSGYIDMCNSPDEETVKEGWAKLQEYIFGNYVLTGTCTNHLYAAMRADLTGYTVCNSMDWADVTEVYPSK